MKKRLLVVTAILFTVLSCKTNEDQNYFSSNSLPGMIYDGENRPCKKVLVRAFRIDGESEELLLTVESDINGRFILPDLERGNYRIEGEKEGYELLVSDISYSSRLEVLYLKMHSQDQILKLAADAMENRRSGQVRRLLLRSEAIDAGNPLHLYHKALFLYGQEEYEEALKCLEAIEERGFEFPYVYLLKGDIYQLGLSDRDKALEALTIFVGHIDDDEVKQRIKELENL